jgi:hypothetical protein
VTESFGPIGPWTDIYQLSAVLYRCITGGKLPDALDRLDSPDDPFLPLSEIPEAVRDYPRPLIDAIDLGLRLHPKHRPRSVAEWRRPFESLLPPPSRKKRVTSPPSATQPPPSSLQTPPADRITPPHSPSSGSPPDLLLWLGGGLLIIILLIVFIIATQ